MFLSTDRQSGIEKIKIIFYGEQIFPYILTIKAVVRKIEIDNSMTEDSCFSPHSRLPV